MTVNASPEDLLHDLQQLSEPGRVRFLNLLSENQKDAILLSMLRDKNATSKDVKQDPAERSQAAFPRSETSSGETVRREPIAVNMDYYRNHVASRKRVRKSAKAEAPRKDSKRSRNTRIAESRAAIHSQVKGPTLSPGTSSKDKIKEEIPEEQMIKIEVGILDDDEHSGDGIGSMCRGPTLPYDRHKLRASVTTFQARLGAASLSHGLYEQQGMDLFDVTSKIPLILAVPKNRNGDFRSIEELPADVRNILMCRHENFQGSFDPQVEGYRHILNDPEASLMTQLCVPHQLARNGRGRKNWSTRNPDYMLRGEFRVAADDDCISFRAPCMHVRKHDGVYVLCIVPLPAKYRKGKTWMELGFWALEK